MYRNYIANPVPSLKERYIKYRNKLKSVLLKAKQSYYLNKFKLASGNLRRTWKLINNVLDKNRADNCVINFVKNGSIINSPKDIVEHFNDYFVNIGSNLASAIPPQTKHFSSYMQNSTSNSLALYFTDANEVINVVNGFSNKSSSGCDNVPVDVMKASILQIAEPLAAMINCSFRTGTFPDNLKIAKVCPVFKSGSVSNFSDYRPISVLPSFSKVFEKIAYNRLYNFVNSQDILTSCQYGFRPKHSTYMAILDMYDSISAALDNNKFAIGIFIDLAKAFDTLNHDLLCRKLEIYGIRGIPLQWFKSYLSNRKQYVSLNGISSSQKNITCGVPQGSIMGPLLFIFYINDIVRCSSLL